MIRRHGLFARKSLGQNFLLDLNLTGRIARAAGPLDGVDRGRDRPRPGRAHPGAARRRRAPGDCDRARSARDRGARGDRRAHYPGRLEIVAGDALEFDARPFLDGGPARIVANLPYNIATALLVSWLTTEPWPPWYDRLVLMFQREVAERIRRPTRQQDLRPAVGAGRLAHAGENPVRHSSVAFRAAAQGDLVGGRVHSPRQAAALRPPPARAGHRGGVRPAPQDAAPEPATLGTDPLPLLSAAGIRPTARAEEIRSRVCRSRAAV